MTLEPLLSPLGLRHASYEAFSGSNVIPMRAHPGLAGLRPRTSLPGAEPIQGFLAHKKMPTHPKPTIGAYS